jgi:hypothetical protein
MKNGAQTTNRADITCCELTYGLRMLFQLSLFLQAVVAIDIEVSGPKARQVGGSSIHGAVLLVWANQGCTVSVLRTTATAAGTRMEE